MVIVQSIIEDKGTHWIESIQVHSISISAAASVQTTVTLSRPGTVLAISGVIADIQSEVECFVRIQTTGFARIPLGTHMTNFQLTMQNVGSGTENGMAFDIILWMRKTT